jgi:hypothetical protein
LIWLSSVPCTYYGLRTPLNVYSQTESPLRALLPVPVAMTWPIQRRAELILPSSPTLSGLKALPPCPHFGHRKMCAVFNKLLSQGVASRLLKTPRRMYESVWYADRNGSCVESFRPGNLGFFAGLSARTHSCSQFTAWCFSSSFNKSTPNGAASYTGMESKSRR